MSAPVAVVSFRGNYLSEIPNLLVGLKYRHAGAPLVCSSADEAGNALDGPTGNRNVVRKLAFEAGGWTHLCDPETVILMEDEALSRFAKDQQTRVLAWVYDRFSSTYGFRLFDPELRRDLFAVGGSTVTDFGVPLPEETISDWSRADEKEVLKLAARLGAPFDHLSEDREYHVYTLDESDMPEGDVSSIGVKELPFPAEAIVARVVGHVPSETKPWWKFW